LAIEALDKKLNEESAPAPLLPFESWLREFDAWVSNQRTRNPHFDDSRDSIYPDPS
jgi:hypothetical protein